MRFFVGLAGLFLIAQTLGAQQVTLGVKAGVNSSWQDARDYHENPYGLTAGVTSSFAVLGPLSLQAELLYSGKGSGSPQMWAMRLHYLEVPLLLRFSPFASARVSPILMIGGAPAVELACTARQNNPDRTRLSDPSWNLYLHPRWESTDCDRFRGSKRDAGYIGAIGAEIKSSRITWTVEARYTGGVTNVGEVYRERNRSIAFLFGFRRAH